MPTTGRRALRAADQGPQKVDPTVPFTYTPPWKKGPILLLMIQSPHDLTYKRPTVAPLVYYMDGYIQYIYIYIYVYVHIYIYECVISVFMCIYVHICIYVCVCAYLFMYEVLQDS